MKFTPVKIGPDELTALFNSHEALLSELEAADHIIEQLETVRQDAHLDRSFTIRRTSRHAAMAAARNL